MTSHVSIANSRMVDSHFPTEIHKAQMECQLAGSVEKDTDDSTVITDLGK